MKILLAINYFRKKAPSRSSSPEVFLEKGVLKIYCKFTGEHLCRDAISIKLQSNFIEITLWHESSPVNLLHIFRTPFPKNTSRRLPVPLITPCYLEKYVKLIQTQVNWL